MVTKCINHSDIVTTMEHAGQEECCVDVTQRIKQFQSRINKLDTAATNDTNNNNSEQVNRNIIKTRSKSLPAKYPLVKDESFDVETVEREEVGSVEGKITAVVSDNDEQEHFILPSVKMLASKFTEHSRARKSTSKVYENHSILEL